MKPKHARLDEVLYAVSQIVYCDRVDKEGRSDCKLGAILGQMDWVTELHRLLNGGGLAMEDPNKRQVGGAHYRLIEYQHWDFVADNGLNYFEGQITKYIARWRKKDGKKDLEKAAHYLDKLITLYEDKRMEFVGRHRRIVSNLAKFVDTYELSPVEQATIFTLLTYASLGELLTARDCLVRLTEEATRTAASRGTYDSPKPAE